MENQKIVPLTDEELKQEASRLIKMTCRTKGSDMQLIAMYVKGRYGEDGVSKLQQKLTDLGCPLTFDKIRVGEWYPEGHNVVTLLAAKQIFNWTEEDVFDVGYEAPKLSLGAKIYIKYLVDPKKMFEVAAGYWKKFVECGDIEPFEFNDKEKYMIYRMRGYEFNPIMCIYLAGSFLYVAKTAIKTEKMYTKETKCIHKGDPYHEFYMNWV